MRTGDGAPVGFWLVPLTFVRLTIMDCVKLARVKGVKAAVSAVLACIWHDMSSAQEHVHTHHHPCCIVCPHCGPDHQDGMHARRGNAAGALHRRRQCKWRADFCR